MSIPQVRQAYTPFQQKIAKWSLSHSLKELGKIEAEIQTEAAFLCQTDD